MQEIGTPAMIECLMADTEAIVCSGYFLKNLLRPFEDSGIGDAKTEGVSMRARVLYRCYWVEESVQERERHQAAEHSFLMSYP